MCDSCRSCKCCCRREKTAVAAVSRARRTHISDRRKRDSAKPDTHCHGYAQQGAHSLGHLGFTARRCRALRLTIMLRRLLFPFPFFSFSSSLVLHGSPHLPLNLCYLEAPFRLHDACALCTPPPPPLFFTLDPRSRSAHPKRRPPAEAAHPKRRPSLCLWRTS